MDIQRGFGENEPMSWIFVSKDPRTGKTRHYFVNLPVMWIAAIVMMLVMFVLRYFKLIR